MGGWGRTPKEALELHDQVVLAGHVIENFEDFDHLGGGPGLQCDAVWWFCFGKESGWGGGRQGGLNALGWVGGGWVGGLVYRPRETGGACVHHPQDALGHVHVLGVVPGWVGGWVI